MRGRGDFAWRGRIAGLLGETAGDVTLTVRNGRVLGHVVVPGAAWRIEPAAEGGHRMLEVVETPREDFETLDVVPLSELREGEQGEDGVPRLLSAPARRAAISRFNVIAFYTPEARKGAGGEEAIRQLEVREAFAEWSDEESDKFGELAFRAVRTPTHKLIV